MKIRGEAARNELPHLIHAVCKFNIFVLFFSLYQDLRCLQIYFYLVRGGRGGDRKGCAFSVSLRKAKHNSNIVCLWYS